MTKKNLLLTGGTGILGREIIGLLPGIIAPSREEMDITDSKAVENRLKKYSPDIIIHAAAYTDVARAEIDKNECWKVNVEGTRNIALCALNMGIQVVHISTDYVFYGDKGNYFEEDPVGPPRNYYALSKLVAEEIVRIVPRHLIIRTSFRPKKWPYPVAFTDVYTSQDYVDIIAPEIALAIMHLPEIPYNTLHIATERKSSYELAKRRYPRIRPGQKAEAKVNLPEDISLNVSRWENLKKKWKEKSYKST